MMKSSISTFAAVVLGFVSAPLAALDMSEPVLCATTQVFECVDGRGCSSVLPEAVNAPTFFRVDTKKSQLRVFKDAPPTKIVSQSMVEDRIVLQGAEDGSAERPDGAGWTLSIETDTGRFVATIAVEQASISLFGACTEPFDD